MNLTFYSKDSNDNKVLFTTSYIKDDNEVIFNDESVSNTTIYLIINNDSIIFKRKGSILMDITIKKDLTTKCHYENEMGLSFDFLVKTKSLLIREKRIEMEYSLFLDGDIISTHKITIIFH